MSARTGRSGGTMVDASAKTAGSGDRPGDAARIAVARRDLARQREVALVELVDRVLAGGVVVGGDIALSAAGVDLLDVSLRALVTSPAPAEALGVAVPPPGDDAVLPR